MKTYSSLNVLLTFAVLLCGCSMQGTHDTPGGLQEFNEKAPNTLRKYDAFYVEQVDAYSVEGDYLRRVDDTEVRRLAEIFRTKIIRELGEKHTSFPQPAKNVGIIKVSMTDVASTYALLQVRPGLVAPNSARGGATIEAQFVDSVSRETVASFRDSRGGEREGLLSGFGKWDGVEKAMDHWAQLLSTSIRR